MMRQQGIDNKKDIMLLLLWSAGNRDQTNEPISGRTRLVKGMFLFKYEALKHFSRGTAINDSNFYEFFAWNFGPFSTQVYDDLTFFLLRGFVEATTSDEEALVESREEWERFVNETELAFDVNGAVDEYEEEKFSLTDRGMRWVESNLLPNLSGAQIDLLRTFKKKIQAPLRAILRYTYETYPSYTDKSIIKEKVLHG